jgi:hypothetical protein
MSRPAFGGQGVHDSAGILLGRRVEVSDGRLVTAFLAFLTNFSIGPPHERMEPVHSLGQDLQQIDPGVKTGDVTELVGQDAALPVRAAPTGEVRRQVDASPQQAPHKRLADILQEPDSRPLPEFEA